MNGQARPLGYGLYQDVTTADFTTGMHIYDYLNGPDIVYIAPDDDVASSSAFCSAP